MYRNIITVYSPYLFVMSNIVTRKPVKVLVQRADAFQFRSISDNSGNFYIYTYMRECLTREIFTGAKNFSNKSYRGKRNTFYA
jgi:hypothetical protein